MAATDRLRVGITCYPTTGGSGIVATELGRQLAARGHQVHFITYDIPFRLDYGLPNIYFHPVEVPHYPLFQQAPYTLALATRLAQVADEQNLDLWHVHYAIPHAASAFLAGSMMGPGGPRLVTTLHGTDITLVGSHPSFAPVVDFTLRQSDAVTAVSEDLRRQTKALFPGGRDIVTVPNFIDPHVFHRRPNPALRRHLAPAGERIVCHISNFRPAKNSVAVVDIFAHLSRRVPAQLLLVGSGPEVDQVRHRAHELGVHRRVRFLGEHADVAALLSVADLFLLPSYFEAFGLAALEAMACGVPVIATRVGGLPELVGPLAGECLFDPDDTAAMVSAAAALLLDEAKYNRWARAVTAQAHDSFAADKVIPRYEAVYRQVLQDGGSQ